MKKQILASFFMALLLAACKKDGSVAPSALSLLTSKDWKPATTDLNPASNPAGNVLYSPVPDCALDDTYRFATDNKVTINGGTLKCAAGETSPVTLDYMLLNDNQKLNLGQVQYQVLELTASQLKLGVALAPAQGSQLLVRIFQH